MLCLFLFLFSPYRKGQPRKFLLSWVAVVVFPAFNTFASEKYARSWPLDPFRTCRSWHLDSVLLNTLFDKEKSYKNIKTIFSPHFHGEWCSPGGQRLSTDGSTIVPPTAFPLPSQRRMVNVMGSNSSDLALAWDCVGVCWTAVYGFPQQCEVTLRNLCNSGFSKGDRIAWHSLLNLL